MTLLMLIPIVFVSYSAMHVYLLVKLRRAFPVLRRWTVPLILAVLSLFAGPFLARMLGNRGYFLLARLAGLVGFTWIAVVFWFFALGLLFDAWNLGVRAGSLVVPGLARWHLPPRPSTWAATLTILLAIAWGLVEANQLKVETRVLSSNRLPPGRIVRLAQISDLHLSLHRGKHLLQRIVQTLESLQPDVVVSTGDLADASFVVLREHAQQFQRLHPPKGCFAVLGNHEYFVGVKQALAFHEAAGFFLLRGNLVRLMPGLWLAGVDDPVGSFFTQWPPFTDERALAEARPADGFVILLKHQPLVSAEAGAWFDLQLSGHTHGGQLFPFEWLLKPIYPYRRGLHEVAPGRWLYVNRGAGTWGPPLRLFARPEITLFVLEGAESR